VKRIESVQSWGRGNEDCKFFPHGLNPGAASKFASKESKKHRQPRKKQYLLRKSRKASFVLAAHPFHTITMEPKDPALRAVAFGICKKKKGKTHGEQAGFCQRNALLVHAGGRFEAAEQSNGLFVERVMLRTERLFREIVNGKIVR